MARAQSHDQQSWQTSVQRQTGVLTQSCCYVFLTLPVCNVYSYSGSATAGPPGETWLWGSTFPHWGLLPGEPASQSHLCYAVTVWTHKSNGFHRLPMLTSCCCLRRQSQHIRNIAEELDPTFQARRQSTERGSQGTGTLNRKRGSQNPAF